MGFHAHAHLAVVALVYRELRVAAHHLHRPAVGLVDVRMTGQREQAAGAGVHLLLSAPVAMRGQRRDGLPILRQQKSHLSGLVRQPPERHPPALAPVAVLELALLARLQRHALVRHAQIPNQPPLGRGFLRAAAGRLAGGGMGNALQRLQRKLPLRHGQGEVGQRRGAEFRVGGAGALGGGRGGALVAVADGEAAEHFAALRRQPGQPGFPGAGVQRAQQRFPPLRVGLEVVQPAAHPAVEQGVQEGRLGRLLEHAALGFHPGRVGHQLHMLGEALVVVPFGGAQHLLQQLHGHRRVDPHQRQQGQREGMRVYEHQAFARAALLVRQGRLDVPLGAFVVATQQGDERLGRRQPGTHRLALACAGRQSVEHAHGGVETALQGVDERDFHGVNIRRRGVGATQFDHRLRLCGGGDHLVEAAGQRGVDALGRQGGDQIWARRIGQNAPRDVEAVLLQFAQAVEFALDHVAPEQHLVLVPPVAVVVVGARPRAFFPRDDGVQVAFGVGEAGERQRPALGDGAAPLVATVPVRRHQQPGGGELSGCLAHLVYG